MSTKAKTPFNEKVQQRYEAVTNAIIAKLASGVIPWREHFMKENQAVSYATGKPYSLINQLLLDRPGVYLTKKQIDDAGGRIRKGSHASKIYFYRSYEKEEEVENEDGTTKTVKKTIMYFAEYNVFHISDTEGVAPRHTAPVEGSFIDDPDAEPLISAYTELEGVKIIHSRLGIPDYLPLTDTITMPEKGQFESEDHYYAALLKQLVRSTATEERLDRGTDSEPGSNAYIREDLIAEIGSALLANELDISTTETFDNSAAYIQKWIDALKGDTRMIVWASSRAEKAANFILDSPRVLEEKKALEKGSVSEETEEAVSVAA